jgi:dTDP-4-amino-4,6-dideoxygalactose transaminase
LFIIGAFAIYKIIVSSKKNNDIAKLEKSISNKTKAIIVVHLYGQMPDMQWIKRDIRRP